MSTELTRVDPPPNTAGDFFMPAMTPKQAVARYNAVLEFSKDIMKDGKDYGTVPGTDKPCLLKPGAEKLCSFFGISPKLVILSAEEDWTGERHGGEPFFYYHAKVQLWRGDTFLGEADGSCNSMESKYRYRWVPEDQVPADLDRKRLKLRGGRTSEFAFAIEKGETGGKYGKPMSYWQEWRDAIATGRAKAVKKKKRDGGEIDAYEMDAKLYRIPNPDIADVVNTVQKMAFKRAMVASVLIVCNASEYFTQDLDDLDYIEPSYTVHHEQAPPTHQGNGNGGAQGYRREPPPRTGPPPAKPGCINAEQWSFLKGTLVRHGLSQRKLLDYYQIKTPGEFPAEHYGDAVAKAESSFAGFKPDATEEPAAAPKAAPPAVAQTPVPPAEADQLAAADQVAELLVLIEMAHDTRVLGDVAGRIEGSRDWIGADACEELLALCDRKAGQLRAAAAPAAKVKGKR